MCIMAAVKRKPGMLLPLEIDICAAARRMRREFHGFALAKSLADGDNLKRLISYGTLYRALARLEAMGMLTSRWEDPETRTKGGRFVDSIGSPTPVNARSPNRR